MIPRVIFELRIYSLGIIWFNTANNTQYTHMVGLVGSVFEKFQSDIIGFRELVSLNKIVWDRISKEF